MLSAKATGPLVPAAPPANGMFFGPVNQADGDTGQPVGVLDPGECEVEGRRVDVGRKLADVGRRYPAVETAWPVRTPKASAGGPYETADRHEKEGRCGGCDCSPLKTSYVETGHTDQATGERPRRQ